MTCTNPTSLSLNFNNTGLEEGVQELKMPEGFKNTTGLKRLDLMLEADVTFPWTSFLTWIGNGLEELNIVNQRINKESANFLT